MGLSKEMEKLAANIDWLSTQDRPAQGWFVSKAGFTPDALTFARQKGIMVSDGQKIERLIKHLSEG